MRKVLLLILPLLLILAGCENSRVVVNGVEEREANEIVVFLASRGIDAQKVPAKSSPTGAGDTGPSMWNIAVPEGMMFVALVFFFLFGLSRFFVLFLLEKFV